MTVVDLDAATGEVVEREYTHLELAQREADALAASQAKAQSDAEEAARVQGVRDSQSELKALGLSDVAVATISGYPYPYSPAV